MANSQSLSDNFSLTHNEMNNMKYRTNQTNLLINNYPNTSNTKLLPLEGQSFILESMLSYNIDVAQMELL